jgi:hypothetical protein
MKLETKTPKFDKALDKILENLVPEKRICKWKGEHKHCEGEFDLEVEDIKFLKILRVPPPNFCPTCRRMRRLSQFNMAQLFKRKCDVPNHDEQMISLFPKECPFPVYDYKYFISDDFDPFSFRTEYITSESPIGVLTSLRKRFPMPSFLNRDPSCINSDYSNGGRYLKNGYYVMACYSVENAWYSNLLNKSRNIMDSRNVTDSEFVYEGFFSDHIYKSFFVYFSSACADSMFLFDCRNCNDCFGCVNLRNKKYCIWNEQYSKEDYESFMKSIYPLSRENLNFYKNKFWELVAILPMNGSRNVTVNNVSGVNLRNSKNLYDVIDAIDSENTRHAEGMLTHKDSMDASFSGGNSSLLYASINIGSHSSKVKFSVSSKYCTDCEFIFNSKHLSNCFMCFGLQNKSYCILNKQYTESEYFELVDKIKLEMLEKGEYSDGIGFEFSATPYNFSTSQISFPLDNKEIVKLGGYLAEEPETNASISDLLSVDQVPETIDETTDDILNKAISCEITKRPFRIIASELEFYRRMKIPLPVIHPVLRMEERIRLAPNGKKYETTCAKCKKEIYSMFDPAKKFLLYCEDCFKKEIY